LGEARGVEIQEGAEVTLAASTIVDNAGVGIMAVDAATQLSLVRSIVRGNQAASPLAFTGGVLLGQGVVATIVESAVLENQYAAVAADNGASVNIRAGHLGKSHLGADRYMAIGVGARFGASVRVEDSTITDNETAGVLVLDQGSALTLTRSLIADNLSNGVLLSEQGTLDMQGVAVLRNHCTGLVANGPNTTLLVEDSLIAETQLGVLEGDTVLGQAAVGLWVADRASVFLRRTSVLDSSVVGLVVAYANLEASQLIIARTAAQPDTAKWGDGLVITEQSTARVMQAAVIDAMRAGVLVDDSGLVLGQTLVAGNSIGMQAQNGVTVKEAQTLPEQVDVALVTVSPDCVWRDNQRTFGDGLLAIPDLFAP
jgi:hypothetical protein